jgi:hypothetical protein
VREVREGKRAPTVVSVYESDDLSVWRELESELNEEGVLRKDVEIHKEAIKTYLKSLLGVPETISPSPSDFVPNTHLNGDNGDDNWDSFSQRMSRDCQLAGFDSVQSEEDQTGNEPLQARDAQVRGDDEEDGEDGREEELDNMRHSSNIWVPAKISSTATSNPAFSTLKNPHNDTGRNSVDDQIMKQRTYTPINGQPGTKSLPSILVLHDNHDRRLNTQSLLNKYLTVSSCSGNHDACTPTILQREGRNCAKSHGYCMHRWKIFLYLQEQSAYLSYDGIPRGS